MRVFSAIREFGTDREPLSQVSRQFWGNWRPIRTNNALKVARELLPTKLTAKRCTRWESHFLRDRCSNDTTVKKWRTSALHFSTVRWWLAGTPLSFALVRPHYVSDNLWFHEEVWQGLNYRIVVVKIDYYLFGFDLARWEMRGGKSAILRNADLWRIVIFAKTQSGDRLECLPVVSTTSLVRLIVCSTQESTKEQTLGLNIETEMFANQYHVFLTTRRALRDWPSSWPRVRPRQYPCCRRGSWNGEICLMNSGARVAVWWRKWGGWGYNLLKTLPWLWFQISHVEVPYGTSCYTIISYIDTDSEIRRNGDARPLRKVFTYWMTCSDKHISSLPLTAFWVFNSL